MIAVVFSTSCRRSSSGGELNAAISRYQREPASVPEHAQAVASPTPSVVMAMPTIWTGAAFPNSAQAISAVTAGTR